MAKILVVDDEESLLEVIQSALVKEGYEVVTTTKPDEALRLIHDDQIDALITDLKMEPIDGIQLLQEAKGLDKDVVVIMITAFGSVETAVEAMKSGAYDYVIKPFQIDEMRLTLKRALTHRGLLKENINLKRELQGIYRFENIVGTSEPMQKIFRKIEKVADTDSTVLIYGESGTGKELVARALHYNSIRREKPFVAVSCSALPESLLESELFGHVRGSFTGAIANKDGLFKAADGGSIFLDEVGTTSPAIQASLLRVIQEKEVKPVGATKNIKVDVRVIAASNERLEDKIKNGTFREDLYYRLSVIPIDLPALRERREDIPLLVEHFMRRALAKRGNSFNLKVGGDVLDIFTGYDWPGNVREIENVIERVVALSDGGVVLPEHLPEKIIEMTKTRNLKEFVHDKERAHIQRILKESAGDKKRAARILGIDLATLYRKIDRWKMNRGGEYETG
ncbi:MAG: sigma-54 dependent transcriptional regulator [Candidatus Aureabacteria bacterium]|nr:sigma-54 dependent transcriptional regulator [Candidatus Auribacterota bacterium]